MTDEQPVEWINRLSETLEIARLYVLRYPHDKAAATVIKRIDDARISLINARAPKQEPAQPDQVCPYIVSGDEGTSYCSLAESPTKRESIALTDKDRQDIIDIIYVAYDCAAPLRWEAIAPCLDALLERFDIRRRGSDA